MPASVVIPAYNEAGNIGRLVEETLAAIPEDMLGEIIVVDDCSADATQDEVAALMGKISKLRFLRHDRQSGQSAALRSGTLAATCPVIATMDGDGQNDPGDLVKMLEQLAQGKSDGVKMISGVRTSRKATGSRRLASRFANWIRNQVLQDNCPDSGCGIRVCERDALVRLPYFTSMHRFLPALFLAHGHKVGYIPVNDRPRLAGVSNYSNFGRAMIGLYDLFGVAWLLRRTGNPGVSENMAEQRDAKTGTRR